MLATVLNLSGGSRHVTIRNNRTDSGNLLPATRPRNSTRKTPAAIDRQWRCRAYQSVSERHAAGKPSLQEQFEVGRCDDRPVGTHRDSGWTDSRRAVLHGDNQSEAIHDHVSGCTASSTTASSTRAGCH